MLLDSGADPYRELRRKPGVVECLLEGDAALIHPSTHELLGVRIEGDRRPHWYIMTSTIVMS